LYAKAWTPFLVFSTQLAEQWFSIARSFVFLKRLDVDFQFRVEINKVRPEVTTAHFFGDGSP
jgi:hypothetical protein